MFRNWSKAFRQGNAAYKLNMLANAVNETVQEHFLNVVGLDIRTIRVLRLIDDNPGITFAEIVDLGAMERSLVSRLIQVLVRGNHIERRNDERDARRFGLHSTPFGSAARRRADLLSETGLKLLFRHLEPSEVAAFIGTMEKLAQWVDSDQFEQEAGARFDEAAQQARTMRDR
ncbi:MarR family winged helix-turn-helix transcriptional regulator [Paracoccus marinaquae]|uniref:MarR family winged helix-turn-helix transcriptional regulator n=1 Tax=Paracoccus marinaquae TaxID=2841926 RepID=A0ABS6AMQ3_9RHOB|nr:MarR family transcriptional regulator [Paracoccus marinaquae]MBU3031875.1 MarR family winged helix-turn-helix transcriptional regulator [Paracoccus marinaquae]